MTVKPAKIQKLVTLHDAYEQCTKVRDTRPDSKNPVVGARCVYDDHHGNHCFIGQLLKDNGWSVPDGQGDMQDMLETMEHEDWQFTPAALDFLNRVQTHADGNWPIATNGMTAKPLAWKEVPLEECLLTTEQAVADRSLSDDVRCEPFGRHELDMDIWPWGDEE